MPGSLRLLSRARCSLTGGVAPPLVATMQKEFEAGAALLELYKDFPYVKKLGYSVGEMEGRILIRVIMDDNDDNDDESFANFLKLIGVSRKFEDMLPADIRDEYEVVPFVTDADEGALRHFRTMTVVIDR